MTITEAEAERALTDALILLNEALAYLAGNGFAATLHPCGTGFFEAHLMTAAGVVIIRPERRPRSMPANQP
jgi:hypothetical protein